MTISSLSTRITGFARTALTAATRKKPPISDLRTPISKAPLAMASIIRPQVRERWLLPQVGAITPQYIEMTLRGALAGAHLPQWELLNLMEDTWPRLRKNVLELKMAVRNRRAVFEAYRDEDEAESPTATERMKLVSAALRKMQPDPAADECAFDDMVSDILDAWFKGVSVLEIDWHLAQTRQLGRFVAPRCTRWVSPVNYAWSSDLRLGVIDDTQQTLAPFPADRVIVAKCKTKSGSILGGALLRPLVWWWCAANFSADWLLNLAQVFGLPFRWATYEPTAAQETVDRICAMLQNMGSAGWAAFPAGTALELKAEGTKSGAQTPQGDMLDRADKQCDLLVLGQTLTTDTGGMGAGGGSHALGQVHADVRAGLIDAAAKFAASVIEQQLIPAILRLNYGDTDEAPTLVFHERGDDDLGARAQWIATLTKAGAGRIIPLDWLAKTFGIPKPDAGEMTLGQAQQEDAAQHKPPRDNPTIGQSDNPTLAARELWQLRESGADETEDAALQAGIWSEDLHPRARGGLFTTKPATPTASAGAAKKPLSAPEPAPAQPSTRAFSPPHSPSDHPEPGQPEASPSQPSTTPRKLLNAKQIIAAMQPQIKQLKELEGLRAEMRSINRELDTLNPSVANSSNRRISLNSRYDLLYDRHTKMRDEIVAQGRNIVALPLARRGTIKVPTRIPKEINQLAEDGMRLAETYVHPKILPRTRFVVKREGIRCSTDGDIAELLVHATPSSAAHEIVHTMEYCHESVLQKSRDFLTKRAGDEQAIPLNELDPGGGYGPYEMAFKDRWKELGGYDYSGKYYGAVGEKHDPRWVPKTELLTVGIQRLHENPALFASTDPEYFSFVVNTFRNL